MTSMTYPSEEDWEELDRMARRYEKLMSRLRYLVLVIAFAIILFVIVNYIAAHSTPLSQDIWSMECQKALRQLNDANSR